MPGNTTNYNLAKPYGYENYNIGVQNDNMDIIDGELKTLSDDIAAAVVGSIPDNSLTNAKLGTDIKVGSLALLDTAEKSSVVGAINEIAGSSGGGAAATTTYDNADSGLIATDVQEAIDETVELVSTKLTKLVGTTAGTGSALTATITGATLDDFTNIQIRLHADLSASATLNVNGLGAKPIYLSDNTEVSTGALTGSMLNLMYNSTLSRWYLLDILSVPIPVVYDVWETWVALAGLTPTDYANLAAVVASATAMTTLANSTNAVDYMILSTSVIMPSVVGSVNAMTKIGLSSYATTSFITNSTWVTAILASANAISGLDASSPISVPTMTSNTAPSGVATADSVYINSPDYAAWKTFDKNDTTGWDSNVQTFPQWVQYEFASAVWVYKFSLKSNYYNGHSRMKNVILKGSNNGTDFVDLTGTILTADNGNLQTFTVNGNVAVRYKYIRVHFLDTYQPAIYDCWIYETNFYGK